MMAVITRQNNILWLFMIAGRHAILETYAAATNRYHPSIPRIFELEVSFTF